MYKYIPYSYYNYEIVNFNELIETINYAIAHYNEYADEARRIAQQYDVQQMIDDIVSLIKK
jgi:hypothetical protein